MKLTEEQKQILKQTGEYFTTLANYEGDLYQNPVMFTLLMRLMAQMPMINGYGNFNQFFDKLQKIALKDYE